MNKIIALLLSSAAVCQAALIPIGISPAGTSAGTGLSPANEIPAVTNSAGSGGTISGGLVFDTGSSILTVTAGYGSAAGFTDLTGPATSLTLNGPAGINENAGVLFDLAPFSFPAVNPALGGVIFGNIMVPTNAVGDLLSGLDYISIGTAANASGEIRGQLVAMPPTMPSTNPPTITCPEPSTVECGTPAVVTIQVSDPAGGAMTVVWSLNGKPVQTNQLAASQPPVATNVIATSQPPETTNVTFTAELPLGTNVVDVAVTDSASNSASCSTMVTVVDTIPPVITNVCASVTSLWPPNHKMVTVTIKAKVTDNCGPAKWCITKVCSNEAANGKGDGNTSPDWKICGDHSVSLRAERAGPGSGRIYTITIQARDTSGNLSAPATVTVTVPKSQGKGKEDKD